MAESVASLVERLLAVPFDDADRPLVNVRSLLREAASRLSSPVKDPLREFCQSEGPYGETICMLPLGHAGPCGWEKLRAKA